MNLKTKLIALGGTIACVAGLAVSASSATGAWYSQTVPGQISGTTGQITATISGGGGAHGNEFTWTNMLPGVANTATVNYANTSDNPENIYLTFPNDTALSALNDLGTYGEAAISTPTRGTIFHSVNLRDERPVANADGPANPHCGGVYSAGLNVDGGPLCNPLRNVVLIAQSVPAHTGGSFIFSFNYASKVTGPQGATFNVYPASRTSSTSYTQHADDSNGSGLPFAVVATQVGDVLTPSN